MRQLNKEEFIKRLFIRRPELVGMVSFDKMKYVKNDVKAVFTCVEHGDIEMLPMNLMRGQGVNCCNIRKGRNAIDKETFVRRYMEKFPDNTKYLFDNFIYVDSITKAVVTCSEHGPFSIKPNKLMSGIGCLKCSIERKIGDKKSFIKKYKGKHNLSKFEYIRSNRKSIVICDKHGEFSASPNSLLSGKGCVKCSSYGPSTQEKELSDFIERNIGSVEIIRNDRSVLGGLELDIYIPSLNIAIEFNGVKWHSSEFRKDSNYHLNKTKKCLEKSIKLIHVRSDLWESKTNIVKSRILNLLGKSERIYARKTKVIVISSSEAKAFMNDNHIQGSVIGNYCSYALEYNGKVVAVMSMCKPRYKTKIAVEYEWELSRYSSLIGTTVVGGMSKLLKHFINDKNPSVIKTYALMDWTSESSNVYEKIGFTKTGVTPPNYCYQKNGKIVGSRIMFQKHKLKAKLSCYDEKLTEVENCRNNGYYQYFDSGNIVFTMNL